MSSAASPALSVRGVPSPTSSASSVREPCCLLLFHCICEASFMNPPSAGFPQTFLSSLLLGTSSTPVFATSCTASSLCLLLSHTALPLHLLFLAPPPFFTHAFLCHISSSFASVWHFFPSSFVALWSCPTSAFVHSCNSLKMSVPFLHCHLLLLCLSEESCLLLL